MAEFIKYNIERGVASVAIARPEVHNAFNEDVIRELREAVEQAIADATVSVIVLRSEGKSFSAGGDLGWMQRVANYTPEENRQDALGLARMLQTIDRSPKPVVARVQGAALGGGVGLVAAADIVVAAETAVFGLTEVRVGLVPAVISPFVVRALGERQARPLFLTGERFSAQEAYRLGLVHHVTSADTLDEQLEKTLESLRLSAPGALSQCKLLIRTVVGKTPEEAAETTADFLAERRQSDEAREGIVAFFEKRKPAWYK